MKKNLVEEEYQRLMSGDSSGLREMLTAFLDSGDAIVIADKDGIIRYVNPTYEKITGYSKEELVGKTPHMISSRLLSDKFYKDMWSKIVSGEVFKAEFINRRKNGDLYYQSETIAPVKDESGNMVGFVSNGRDTTEDFYNDRKFSLFGKMSSSVLLHQMQDPILQIRAAAVRLRDFAIKSNDLKILKDLDTIYTTNKQMEHTLGVLREFFYPPFNTKDSADIKEVVSRALESVQSKFNKEKLSFEVKYEDVVPRASLHEKLWEFVLEEILHHVASAALLSKQKNSVISITVRLVEKDIVIYIDGAGGTPVNSKSSCDETCGCTWVDGTDLKFVLMEIVITEARGIIRYEQMNDDTFRTTLVIPKVI